MLFSTISSLIFSFLGVSSTIRNSFKSLVDVVGLGDDIVGSVIFLLSDISSFKHGKAPFFNFLRPFFVTMKSSSLKWQEQIFVYLVGDQSCLLIFVIHCCLILSSDGNK
ncbi:unnamed protein product [Chrysodeixis includens]|uniref:Uncharacterized protein n=1 Tax=Chrysodeixis includens TaxID=689277 RepID=A0A9N8KVI2_CHRIL|nr:unnamed protein product [Chrysodeixis includens]